MLDVTAELIALFTAVVKSDGVINADPVVASIGVPNATDDGEGTAQVPVIGTPIAPP
jgi:hypothetical protein